MSIPSLERLVNLFKSRDINAGCTNESFEEILLKINSSSTIDITQQLLERLHNRSFTRTETKAFLSSYMIISNPDDIFSEFKELEKVLFDTAKKLVNKFDQILTNRTDLIEYTSIYNKYIELFRSWQNGDKDKMRSVLAQSYYELEETQRAVLAASNGEITPDVEIWGNEISNQKRQIEDAVKVLSGNFDREELMGYLPEEAEIVYRDEVFAVAEKAYWDSFEQELEEKNYKRVITLLTEIRTRLTNFTPNRGDLKNELDEYIDVELIEQMITHNAYSNNDLVSLVFYILDRILALEAPAENASTEELKNEIIGMCERGETHIKMLPFVLRNICYKLDKIEDDLEEFYSNIRT